MDLGAFASRVSGVTEGRVHKGDAPPSQQGDDECAMYDDSPGGCWVREPPYHPGRQIDYDKQRDAKDAARKAADSHTRSLAISDLSPACASHAWGRVEACR